MGMKKERKGEGITGLCENCLYKIFGISPSVGAKSLETGISMSSSSSLPNTMQYCNFVFTNITLSHHDLKEHQGPQSDLAQLEVFRSNTPLTSFLPYWPPAAIGIA